MRKQFGFKRLLVFVFAFVLSAGFIMQNPIETHAASKSRDIFGMNADYTSVHYDSSSGMPTSEANAITQTSDGFIWLGGYSGLVRFDGSEFYRYDSSTGISSVFSLYVDEKNRIWIGTNENGVVMMYMDEVHPVASSEGVKSDAIRSMIGDNKGNIIVGTTQGLAYVDGETLEMHPISDARLDHEYINSLTKDKSGTVYGLTSEGAVFIISDLKVTAFFAADKINAEQINAIYADPDENEIVYLGTTGSEVVRARVNGSYLSLAQRYHVAPQNNINALTKRDKDIWVTATDGVGYIDSRGSYHEIKDAPLNYSVNNVMTDMEGNLWFTSTRQGVMKLVPNRFMDISKMAGLDNRVINSTCVNNNLLYLGTDSGLEIVDLATYRPVTNELTELLDDVRIRCVKNDKNNRIWLCTHGDTGLVCYNPTDGEIKIYNEENGLDTNRVRAVMQCPNGDMAAATGNGLFIISGEKVVDHFGQESGMSSVEVLSAEATPDGLIYMGSDGDGIYVVNDKRISRLGIEDGLTSEVVLRVKWDEQREMLWIITSNSIEYMQNGEIKAVTKFPYSNNYDMYFDGKGRAWILSSNGIYVADVDTLIGDEKLDYTFYDQRSGLPYIATGNSRDYLSPEGILYVAGTTGVFAANIEEDDYESQEIKLTIPAVVVDDKEILISDMDKVTIPAGCKRLVIKAYALTYGLTNPTISYYLEGFDDEPIITRKQELTPISYTNLDGGRYTFHLNVIDEKTGEIKQSEEIHILKEHSIYDNFLFWIFIVILGVGMVGFFMWKGFADKQKTLLKKQEEDKKYIDQIMHTMAKSIDLRDQQNQGHSFRVAYYTRLLAKELKEKRGYTDSQIDEFYHVALLHDIGKLSIPDRILNKPERLNDEEYMIMRTHAENGAHMLRNVTIVKDLSVGAGCHHERIDGKGYPKGLKGKEIPEVARIIAVADTFDAMYSTRPYRKQLDINIVLDELEKIKGTQLDEEVVDALLAIAGRNELNKEKVDEAISNLDVNKEHVEMVEEIDMSKLSVKKQEHEDAEFLNDLGF
jgi:energy-coupling factor transport system substrate-specific component